MALKHRTLHKKLRRDIWSRKGRLAALLLVVSVGVGGFVGMAALHRNLGNSRDNYYRECRIADFTVDLERAPVPDVNAVGDLPNVASVQGRVNVGALVRIPGVRKPVAGSVISMPVPRRPVVNDVLLVSGTWFSGPNRAEAVLNSEFAEANGLKPGHRLRVHLLDQAHDVLVVGTAMSPEFTALIPPGAGFAPDPARMAVMYMPLPFLREASDLEGAYNQAVGLAHDRSSAAMKATLGLVEEALDHCGVLEATPYYHQFSVQFLEDEIRGLRVTTLVLPSIFLGVAALALGLLLSRMVAQQRSVVGTLKAVGYGRGAIVWHFLAFGLTVGLAGGVLGGLLGMWLEVQVVEMYHDFFALPDIEAGFHPDLLLAGLGLSVLFSTAGALKGALGAARLAPAVSMRPPPPKKGRALLPDGVPWLRRRLSFHWKMVLRMMFRSPWRSAASVAASLTGTSILLTSLSMMASWVYMIDHHFVKTARQDLTASLREPQGREAFFEVARLPGVLAAEPQFVLAADIRRGPRRRRLGVTGLPRLHRLYTPVDAQDRPIAIPPSGLVLSRRLAEALEAYAGDTVVLRPALGRQTPAEAQVHAVVDTYLGLSAYADLEYLSRLVGEEWCANALLFKTGGGRPPQALLDSLADRPAVIGLERRQRVLERMDAEFREMMAQVLGTLIVFSGIIAFASVLNIALITASEHKRDAATLRAVGYHPAQIAAIFTTESYLLNALGILGGVAGGALLIHLLSMAIASDLYRLPALIPPDRVALTVLLMLVFVTLGQTVIFRMVRRLDWLETVKVRE